MQLLLLKLLKNRGFKQVKQTSQQTSQQIELSEP